MEWYWEVIGGVGMALIFVAYALNYQQIVKRNSRTYDYLNLVGAFFLFSYAITTEALIFIMLNLVWTGLALMHILKREIKLIADRQKPVGRMSAKNARKASKQNV